jgi:hypothetical protein
MEIRRCRMRQRKVLLLRLLPHPQDAADASAASSSVVDSSAPPSVRFVLYVRAFDTALLAGAAVPEPQGEEVFVLRCIGSHAGCSRGAAVCRAAGCHQPTKAAYCQAEAPSTLLLDRLRGRTAAARGTDDRSEHRGEAARKKWSGGGSRPAAIYETGQASNRRTTPGRTIRCCNVVMMRSRRAVALPRGK